MSEDYRPEESVQEELTGEEKAKRQTISFQMLQGKPYVTWFLIGFTAAVYLAQAISKWQFGTDVVMFTAPRSALTSPIVTNTGG